MIAVCENGPLEGMAVVINPTFSQRVIQAPIRFVRSMVQPANGTDRAADVMVVEPCTYLLIDAWWDEIDQEYYGTLRHREGS